VNRTLRIMASATVLAAAGSGAVALAAAGAGGAGAAMGSKKNIEPQADRLLREMADYLAGLKSFKVRSSAVDEVVTAAGQKIQVPSESEVTIERPNRLRSEQLGAENGMGFWYDGQTMTLACKSNNTYAKVPAPANLDDTIDKARKQFQIEAPGADLLYSHPYDILTEQVTGGRFIGRESMDGKPVNHLAFQGEDVDWQIWIQDGAQPLPVRYEITTKNMKGAPEFAVRLTNWQVQPKMTATVFAFEPTAGAKQAQAFPSSCGAPGH
jgi:hypothetical protein